MVIQSGAITTTEGLGGYIWQGIAASTSRSGFDIASQTGLDSNSAIVSRTSSLGGITSTQAAASTGTESASSAQISTSEAGGDWSVSSYKTATMALVVCLFAIIVL